MTPSRKLFLGMFVLCCGFGIALLFRKDTISDNTLARSEHAAESMQEEIASAPGGLVLRHASNDTPRYALEGWPTRRTDPPVPREHGQRMTGLDQLPTLRDGGDLRSQVSMESFESLQPITPPTLPSRFPRSIPHQYGARPVYGSIFFQMDTDRSEIETPPELRAIHRVQDGDTLRSLAERYLGNADRADEIFASNRDQLAHPEVLPIGIVLRLPTRDAAIDSKDQGSGKKTTRERE